MLRKRDDGMPQAAARDARRWLQLPQSRVTLCQKGDFTMTKTNKHDSRLKEHIFSRDLGGGISLRAEVSPCVFMDPGYPLQITVTLHRRREKSLGTARAVDRSKTAATFASTDVERLLECVRITPCPRCAAPAFDPRTVETNRNGLCEMCFLRDLEAECAVAAKAAQERLADRDRRMKERGMAVRVSACVHPESGDDYAVDWYFPSCPTSAQVRMMLLQEGSCLLHDYTVIAL
jgi:hypothetical protein